MKNVLGVYSSTGRHWVGDGFPVRTLFSYQDFGRHTNPFLLLDYAGPAQFAPCGQQRARICRLDALTEADRRDAVGRPWRSPATRADN